jgi:hypothetical protein
VDARHWLYAVLLLAGCGQGSAEFTEESRRSVAQSVGNRATAFWEAW